MMTHDQDVEQLLAETARARAERDKARASEAHLREVLALFIDTAFCDHDANGYCRAHGMTKPCRMRRARAALLDSQPVRIASLSLRQVTTHGEQELRELVDTMWQDGWRLTQSYVLNGPLTETTGERSSFFVQRDQPLQNTSGASKDDGS